MAAIELEHRLMILVSRDPRSHLQSKRDEIEWQDACAEADQLDPGWRWNELSARQPSLPEDQDATKVALAAANDLPADFFVERLETSDELGTMPIDALRKRLEGVSGALDLAQKLAQLEVGQHIIEKRPIMGNLPHSLWRDLRRLSTMIRLQAALAAKERRADEALAFGLGGLGISRAACQPPILMSALVSLAIKNTAIASILQALKHGEPSETALAATQFHLQELASRPVMLEAMRGERACFYDLIGRQLDEKEFDRGGGKRWPLPLIWLLMPKRTIEEVIFRLRYGKPTNKRRSSWMLRFYSAVIELLKTSIDGPVEQPERMKDIGRAAGYVTRQSAVGFRHIFFADRRTRGYMACTIAALAAERYRLITSRWPDSLDEVPGCLESVPLNPHTLKSVDFQRTRHGCTIRSRGKKYEYMGGLMPLLGGYKRGDMKAEIWDVEQRRRF